MQNITEKIFEQTFTNEYSSQMTQSNCAKVIYNVINHGKKKPELTLKTGEILGGKDEKHKKLMEYCRSCMKNSNMLAPMK
jgi:hypothetical protein